MSTVSNSLISISYHPDNMQESRKGKFLLLEEVLTTISTGKYRICHGNQEVTVTETDLAVQIMSDVAAEPFKVLLVCYS